MPARLADRRLLLAAIVLLAMAVRLAGMGDRLSDAEGYSWLVAAAPDADGFFDRLAAYENTPPLFYALLALTPLNDEAWLRLPALVPALGSVVVLYCVVRPALGTRVALLAALGLAVAPYHVSYSNYSRGFMLAGLGLLVATWAVARLIEGRRARWWWLYLAGAVLALHAEYYSVLFLAPLLLALALSRRRPPWEVALLALVPLLTLLPLVGEMARGLEAIDETKFAPTFPEPTPAKLRDTVVALAFGEHGTAAGELIRWGQLAGVVAALAGSAWLLTRRSLRLREPPGGPTNTALALLVAVPAATVGSHALVAVAGPDLLDQRYLSGLIPLGAALIAYGVCALRSRLATAGAVVAAIGLAGAIIIQRSGRELEPDYGAAARSVRSAGARPVLTNSAVVHYYLRDREPVLDRPFGRGAGSEASCLERCHRPYAVVEDRRQGEGARPGPGAVSSFGPIVVRVVRAGAAGAPEPLSAADRRFGRCS